VCSVENHQIPFLLTVFAHVWSLSFVKRIYVGNLSWSTSDEDLREFFSQFGTVQDATVITDRDTGRSRGFGFVEMDDADGDNAISEANGASLGGRNLRVNEAQPRESRGGGGGGGHRGGGGGGGGRW
jgi:RNA recognition motif-containing protein